MAIEVKPPLGIKPRYIVAEQRYQEILEGIDGFKQAENKLVPAEWFEELAELSRWLDNFRNRKLR